MKTNRILCLLLALALAALTVGCKAKTPEAPAEAEAEPPAQTEEAESITRAATGIRDDEIVAFINDITAPAEMLTYQVGYCCSYLDYMMQSYGLGELDLAGTLPDGTSVADYVREESLTLLRQQLTLEQLAAENGVTLTAEDEAELAAQRDAQLTELGEETYLAQLHSMGVGQETYDRIQRSGMLYQALSDAAATPGSPLYASDEELSAAAVEAGYLTADHILLMTVDPTTREPLDEETVEAKRALAEELLWRLRDSSDPVALFAQLAAEYGEDPGREANPYGYTFTYGTMVDAFDSAARALGENEYSDVVESEYGYHIILRRPLDVAAAADAVRSTAFDDLFLARAEAADMTLAPVMDDYDFIAVAEALRAAQAEVFGAGEESADSTAP